MHVWSFLCHSAQFEVEPTTRTCFRVLCLQINQPIKLVAIRSYYGLDLIISICHAMMQNIGGFYELELLIRFWSGRHVKSFVVKIQKYVWTKRQCQCNLRWLSAPLHHTNAIYVDYYLLHSIIRGGCQSLLLLVHGVTVKTKLHLEPDHHTAHATTVVIEIRGVKKTLPCMSTRTGSAMHAWKQLLFCYSGLDTTTDSFPFP